MTRIQPTVPGMVEGIISDRPRILQCQECGVTDDAASVGSPQLGLRKPVVVHLRSSLRFHSVQPWPDGRTDNPRLCRDCRLARGCHCQRCDEERRQP